MQLVYDSSFKPDLANIGGEMDGLAQALIKHSMPDSKRRQAMLAIEETLDNAIMYGVETKETPISLNVFRSSIYLIANISYKGMLFDPSVHINNDPSQEVSTGGYGLLLVQAYAQKITHTYADDSNHVGLIFDID